MLLPLVLLSGCALVERPVHRALGSFERDCGPVADDARCQALGYEGAERFQRELPGVPVESVELREGPDGRIVAWVCGSRPRLTLMCGAMAVEDPSSSSSPA